MSYLSSDVGLPDFRKAVISLWFRVPQTSVDAAKADQGYDKETMIGGSLVPLLVFGGIVEGYNSPASRVERSGVLTQHTGRLSYGSFVEDYPTTTETGFNFSTITDGFANPTRLSPSSIAVNCAGDYPVIAIRLQTTSRPKRTGQFFNTATGTSSTDLYYITSGGGASAPPSFMREQDWVHIGDDVTDFILSGRPETFLIDGNVPIAPDVWHHLLVSFDIPEDEIGNGKSSCRIWMAIDDVNCTGDALGTHTPDGFASNTLFPYGGGAYPDEPPLPIQTYESGWYSRGSIGDPPIFTYVWIDTTVTGSTVPITYRFTPPPLVGSPVSIPGPGGSPRKVQMAELQIFTGVTLDTSVEANRRAFINSKGQPVDEAYGVVKYRGIYGPKTPNVTPSAPIKLLGRSPDVAIVRSARNWMSGFGFNKTSFRPHGKIRPVKPDPVRGK